MFKNLVLKNRSYRRFYEEESIARETLLELIDLARFSPSAGNIQPLKYFISCEPKKNSLIFPHLGWAAYIPEWSGPAPGERPSAYIIILGDKNISQSFGCDHGIAAQTIRLGATEKGLGACIIGSINRKKLEQALNLPAQFEILLVIALGKPREVVVLESVGPDGDIKYWRDQDGKHHVPKRTLEEIIVD
ncbi:nitroreductase family protein [Desulfohalobiaceae bacterium Ax17]|uniref:nitroreductase family protein n=1 Tax=Desulfovulcanus ferrireducens TaxID=2831190 RepID=UPI00207BB030|nr:nitroreductase family protein [Desulfovulcanus ferrireducens]MBT8764164.1 nitroreductase family protein [Desulfovulcanus ferrireducens]